MATLYTIKGVTGAARRRTAYTELCERIIRGRIGPGTRLTETDVARQLGVSRTPAREALQRLFAEGFLVRANQGRRIELAVSPLTRADLIEVYRGTSALEGAAARGVAELSPKERKALAARMNRLTAAFQSVGESRPDATEEMFDLHNAFHDQIDAHCAGPRIRALLGAIRPHVQRYEWVYAPFVGSQRYRPTFVEHKRIVAAIARGNPEAAERAVRANWDNSATRLVQALDRVGERGDWVLRGPANSKGSSP
jgi:DNA-binding GntR family transcriptional regulator